MSDCKVFRSEIEGAADGGALGPRAAAHAETCEACGAELRGSAALRGLVRGLGRVEAPSDFEYRLRARMAASKPGGGHGLFAGLFPVGGLAWAAVAVCVLSVTAGVYFKRAQPAMTSAPNEVASASRPDAGTSTTGTKNNESTTAQQSSQTSGVQTAATVTPITPAPQRVTQVTYVSSPRTRERARATREPRVDSTEGGSVVADVHGARVQLPSLNSNSVASRAQAQGIQLGTTAGTLRVAMRDERGALVPMRSVSFGSQEPLSRQTASSRAGSNDDEGVW